ncbi:hypothetical protein Tco_1284567 [Tanacetum coccineum]
MRLLSNIEQYWLVTDIQEKDKNEAKTTKPSTEWKSVKKTKSSQSQSQPRKLKVKINPDKVNKSKPKPKA